MGYIDLERALNLLGGSKALYYRLLLGFLNTYRQADHLIKAAYSTGDFEKATLLAHSLKGVCGNLGAYELVANSKALEYAFRDQKGDYEVLIQSFSETLKGVVSELLIIKTDYELLNKDRA